MKYQAPTAKVLSNLGFAYQKTGNFEKAAESYKKAIGLDNKDAGAFYNLALILAKAGKRSEAMQVLQKAFSEVPEGAPGLPNLRELFERLKS